MTDTKPLVSAEEMRAICRALQLEVLERVRGGVTAESFAWREEDGWLTEASERVAALVAERLVEHDREVRRAALEIAANAAQEEAHRLEARVLRLESGDWCDVRNAERVRSAADSARRIEKATRALMDAPEVKP